MFSKELVYFLVICFVFFQHLSNHATEGTTTTRRRMLLSSNEEEEEEDMELERQLEILNKPAIKTFQTKYGDVYGCVDINKQPAFDHPLLKNHTIQMSPSKYPEGMIINEEGSSHLDSSIWHKSNETCPHGTVPIKRIQKEDLIRAKSSKFITKSSTRTNTANTAEYPGYHFATVEFNRGEYRGIQTFTNTHKPSVEHGQFSAAAISISNQEEIIAAGWRVDPSIQGDFNARMFIFWTADDSKSTGCYNVFCSGFVQVDKDPIDIVIEKISVYGGPQYVFQNSIFQDKDTGNWWFVYPEGPKKVGYWPKELFKNLASQGGNHVEWGGQTFSPPTKNQNSPAMGNGHFPQDFLKYDANGYFKRIEIIDKNYEVQDPADGSDFIKSVDNPKCYDLGDVIDLGGTWMQTFNYGGPGGDCGK